VAWIELHQSLPAHRKIKKLKRLLKVNTPQAVGHMAMLWLWSLDNAPDGDLSQVDPEDIAEACEWSKNADSFVAALKDASLIDDDMHLHDWDDYTGRLMDQREEKRKKERDRKAAYRAKKRDAQQDKRDGPKDVPRDSPAKNGTVPPLPDQTLPDQTLPDQTGQDREGQSCPARPRSVAEVAEYAREIGSTVSPQDWWDYCAARGWRAGNGPMRDWKAAFRSSQGWERWKQGESGSAANWDDENDDDYM